MKYAPMHALLLTATLACLALLCACAGAPDAQVPGTHAATDAQPAGIRDLLAPPGDEAAQTDAPQETEAPAPGQGDAPAQQAEAPASTTPPGGDAPGADPVARIVYRGPKASKKIAITIDDCWSEKYIKRTLKYLKEYGVKATYFPTGHGIDLNPGVWQQVLDEGHEIGNHTYSHLSLNTVSPKKIAKELRRTQEALDKALGYEYKMRFMRPPRGEGGYKSNVSQDMLAVMDEMGYTHAFMWTSDQTDAKKMLKQTQNGAILLFHTVPESSDCLRDILPKLLERGYEPVTLSEMLGLD